MGFNPHALLAGLTIVVASPLAVQAQSVTNPEIQVGVVQRFGSDPDDQLTLEPLTGDQLTLTFTTGPKVETVRTTKVVLETVEAPLLAPELAERVVLSSHGSFESAEDSANQWRARGIEAEIAQPDSWEVWASREVYSSPLLRRLLLQNLQEQGYTTAFLDSEVLAATPKAAFIANGFRYNRDRVEITSNNRRIRVTQGENTSGARLYGGELRLQPNAYGTYTLVNEVPIETYLRGVVPHEIGAGAPQNTIEAQAILARTYALRNLRRFAIDDYELCASTHCQVYWGLGGTYQKTDQAIAATNGQVLTYGNELVDALYSSTTGGITAPFSDVWNGPDRPYLKSVVDSTQNVWDLASFPLNIEANFRRFISLDQGFNEEEWAHFRWQAESSLAEVTQDLKTYLQAKQHPLAGFNRITQMAVTERAASGRIQILSVATDIGQVDLDKDEVRRALSAPRSQLFYVEPILETPAPTTKAEPDFPTKANQVPEISPPDGSEAQAQGPQPILKGFRFIGGGWGHGVGMSQAGSYRLGALGWSSERIVEFYYPGATVQTLNPSLVFWQEPPSEPTTATTSLSGSP
ncbi:amidase [filamentous cyanobacterium CCP5]|nr:amidase [filamentous cyanobacterium CCP5]